MFIARVELRIRHHGAEGTRDGNLDPIRELASFACSGTSTTPCGLTALTSSLTGLAAAPSVGRVGGRTTGTAHSIDTRSTTLLPGIRGDGGLGGGDRLRASHEEKRKQSGTAHVEASGGFRGLQMGLPTLRPDDSNLTAAFSTLARLVHPLRSGSGITSVGKSAGSSTRIPGISAGRSTPDSEESTTRRPASSSARASR